MDGACGQDLIGNPGLFDFAHKFDGFFRRYAPHIIVFGQADGGAFLFGSGGPVIVFVQGLHIKIDFDAGFFKRHRHRNIVTCHAGNEAVLLDERNGLGEQVNPADPCPCVTYLTLNECSVGAVINCYFYPAGQVV